MKKIIVALICLSPFLLSCNAQKNSSVVAEINPFKYTSSKKVIAENGAVVSAHPLASKVGVVILKMGGNAVDAAIATQLALAVVYPAAGNIGGGGFLVGRLSNGELISIDYREKAPGSASRDMYIDETGKARTDLSQNGHLAGGVPGTVSGLFTSHQYAKLPFSKLIQPAIDLAEKGFAITSGEARAFNSIQESLKKYNSVMPAFVKQTPWKEGDTLIQTDLANTLKRIQKNGAAGFYEGETANLLVAEMKRGNGIISLEDLKNYKAKPRTPQTFNYKGYKIVGMGMPSSGGLLMAQMMKMIEGRGIDKMGFHSVQAVQLMTEVQRRAYADRAEYMGDADHYNVPVEMLASDKYLKERMKSYKNDKATPSTEIKPRIDIDSESEETTHLSVIDKEGNAISVTTTLNGGYGSKTVIGGAGFFLNNEMDDFSIKPGVPNMFGAVGGDANAIKPGKRMLSSMTPTLVLKDDKPFIVVGTPGGTTIPTQVFETLVNILDFNMSTEDAVYKPKFHHQWLPDRLDVERGFPQAVKEALQKMGYTIYERGSIGRTEIIKVLPNGKFEAVADNRGEDAAEGY
ncbi:MAG TPA: gamma-glutamyltransferase [Chitinophagaceae bacterium]|nr:gamma-glutamyltransferase [Chitinophagaceae bacterium]MBP8114784.1 gamma-glutamyltransferase [Chitinophagaceae bacterium]HQV56300.1 gamma-glutamyltransferase [Chitinophagaceae bacterium]